MPPALVGRSIKTMILDDLDDNQARIDADVQEYKDQLYTAAMLMGDPKIESLLQRQAEETRKHEQWLDLVRSTSMSSEEFQKLYMTSFDLASGKDQSVVSIHEAIRSSYDERRRR